MDDPREIALIVLALVLACPLFVVLMFALGGG